MNRVTIVTKFGRLLLEIGEDRCRYFLTPNEVREFRLQDIAQVERQGNLRVCLWDSGHQLLAAFRMNMQNGAAAMRFFRDCNLHRLTDGSGNLLPEFEILVTPEKMNLKSVLDSRWTEEESTFYAIFLGLAAVLVFQELLMKKNYILMVEAVAAGILLALTVGVLFLWALGMIHRKKDSVYQYLFSGLLSKKKTAFYQTPAWLNRIRGLALSLNIIGILLACLFRLLPASLSMKLSVLFPLIIWGFYLCFYQVMDFAPSHMIGKIMVPWPGALYFSLAVSNGFFLHLERKTYILIMRGALFVILAFLFCAAGHKCKSRKSLALQLALLACICFLGTEGLPVLFDTGENWHQTVEVVEKEISGGGRGAVIYYLDFLTDTGDKVRYSVSEALYFQVEDGDSVWMCWHSGMLSDYFYFHQPDEGHESMCSR